MALTRTGISSTTKTHIWNFSNPPRTFTKHRYCTGRKFHIVKSSSDEDKVDWDAAWSQFKNTTSETGGQGERTGQEQKKKTSTAPPPRFDRRRKTSSPLDAIRKEEDRVLGVWSSTAFSQLGIASAAFLLVVILVLAGGPPSDARCTLPWCS
eukprot:jgi/Picre1/34241/NNA_001715.t1